MSHEHAHATGYPWRRVTVWVGLSLLALWVLLRGHSDLYIAPNIRWTLWLAVIVSLALAALDGYAAWLRGDRPDLHIHEAGAALSLGLPLAPVALGIVIPPSVLGAGSLSGNDAVVSLLPAPAQAQQGKQGTPLQANLLQLQDRLRQGSLREQTAVQVTGFVLHAPDMPAHTWLLVRYATPHCVTEAHPLALLVQSDQQLADNTWVTVSGALEAATVNGRATAEIVTPHIQSIATPNDPYLVY